MAKLSSRVGSGGATIAPSGLMISLRPPRALEAHRHETAIIPSVAGWARLTGLNTIFVDARDPTRTAFTCSERP
jgi:hypothetical protein